MRLKWSQGSEGTILSDRMLSPEANLKYEQTQMQIFNNARHNLINNCDNDDNEDDCESARLHASESDGLFQNSDNSKSVYKGIIYSSASSFFFSLCSAIVKYLDNIHPGELAVFRFVGILVLTIPMLIHHREPPLGPPNLRHFLFLRGIAGATSLYLRFIAFRYLPIADASVIIFSVPVFVSIFACVFLSEPCGGFQIMSVALTMVGLALTTKLPALIHFDSNSVIRNITADNLFAVNGSDVTTTEITKLAKATEAMSGLTVEHYYGVAAAMASTFFAASVYIVVRKAKSAHHSVIMFNFGWVALIETVIITACLDGFSWPTSNGEWSLIVCLGVFSFFGQLLLTRSLQLEAAGPVSVVRAATDIALAFVWQLWLFNEIPDGWSISGAILVTLCVVLTSVRKWVLNLPEHSILRQRLMFMI